MPGTQIQNYVGAGTHAARPATPSVPTGGSALYYETDTTNTFVWTGAAWVQVNGGGGGGQQFVAGGLSVPVAASFAWINQGGAAATNQASGPLTLTAPASGSNNLRFFGENVPGSAPWTATAEFTFSMSAQNYHYCGIAVSDGTKFTIFTFTAQGNYVSLFVQNWGNTGTFSSSIYQGGWAVLGPATFLRVYNDGTDYNFQVSCDGINYATLLQQAVAAFLTATKVGFLMENQDASDGEIVMNVFGWEAVTGTGTVLTF
jgi:hypothetical protein